MLSIAGGTCELVKSVAATQTADFAPAGGALDLVAPLLFAGEISGFTAGDTSTCFTPGRTATALRMAY